MNHNVQSTIQRWQMIEAGDTVYVALSGGADSVVLLHLLRALGEKQGFEVRAMHLNHQLRGSESRRDEQFVRKLCAGWNIPLTVESAPVQRIAKRYGLSVEECARKVRYRFFERCAQDPCAKIATAHTGTDSCETVLLNLLRGTGLRGLCGIPPVRGKIIRPLISVERKEVEAYCRRNHLSFVTDSSNLQDAYLRNRIRHYILPFFKAENPRFERQVMRMSALLREDADFLEECAYYALDELRRADGIYRPGFLGLPTPVRARMLRVLLLENGLRYDSARLERMEILLRRGFGTMPLSEHAALWCAGDRFDIRPVLPRPHKQPPRDTKQLRIFLPGIGQMVEVSHNAQKRLRLSCVEYENFENYINNQPKLLKNSLDYDKIEKIADLRSLRPADTIRPVGRGCTKTMKNLWSEMQVPLAQRRSAVALSSRDTLLWAEGVGADERCAPGSQTKRLLTIEIMEE